MKDKLRLPPRLAALWADEKRRANLLLVLGIAGMLLLAFSEWVPARPQATADTAPAPTEGPTADYAADLERRLQALLEQVEGAGRVQVMVTLHAGGQTVYAKNTDVTADGAARSEHVLVAGTGTGTPALVEQVTVPAVQGVAVVCDGGGSAAVQSRVTDIVAVLTGVGTSHITVTPMVTAQYREG